MGHTVHFWPQLSFIYLSHTSIRFKEKLKWEMRSQVTQTCSCCCSTLSQLSSTVQHSAAEENANVNHNLGTPECDS